MLHAPIETLKQYVNQPSGSLDAADVAAVAELIAADFASLGFSIQSIPGKHCGPTLSCTLGQGEKTLLLMGHMDTVFPHAMAVPFQDLGDGKALGSGIADMKGGVMILLYALKQALPSIDLNRYRLHAVINPDEEIGSQESHDIILHAAQEAFAALSFEPSGQDERVTCARKGVTNVNIRCTGVPGHAGAQYKTCASAVEALCKQISKLYALRDDEKDISFNAGVISGGTAENIVASEASARCEFRYFDEKYKKPLMDKILALCAQEPVPGAHTSVSFGASHPAIDLNEKSQALLSLALAVAEQKGIKLHHEKTGGAGDIAIAGQAGIGVLDGLGMPGGKMHTVEEFGYLDKIPQQIDFAAALLAAVCKETI
ncbi:MAG TPA: M20/M25/M40 family metallo-hydrolase [Candidatus Aphodomonas merdavium]|nr:M20/M25/M40 family metallo-hydrolase [Candidatus Aphodomonas merdavium]